MTRIAAIARLAICGTSLALVSAVVCAQPNGGGPGPVLGIVEIPEMFFVDPSSGEAAPRAALTLYTRPDSTSTVLPPISAPDAIDSAEYGYEELGALVYGRERGYYLIRTARGLGWLSPHKAGAFHPFEKLIARELTYLTDAWDGFVSASPAGAIRSRVAPRRPYGPENVRVKRLQTVQGRLWAEIEVISHSVCESDKPPTVTGQGWIRAHGQDGAPAVWFASRGC